VTRDTGALQPNRAGSGNHLPTHRQSDSLADVLERVLDKGIVIAGDIQIRLLDIELLTIKIRLLVASVDKAREMGINWWESDEFVTSHDADEERELSELSRRLEALEGRINESPQVESNRASREEEARGRS
jgi:hypothetical protein